MARSDFLKFSNLFYVMVAAILSIIILVISVNAFNPKISLVLNTSTEIISKEVSLEGKPGLDVNISYQLPKKILPGEVANIKFILSPSIDNGTLLIEIEPENIEVLNIPDIHPIPISDNSTHEFSLMIYKGNPGKGYLNIFITQTNNHTQSTQAHSIPITIGEQSFDKVVNDPIESEIQIIHSMPAEEVIIQK